MSNEEESKFEGLTPEEEKVIRMRHGLSEDGSHELKFALGANDEAKAKLALMEKHLVETFEEPDLVEEEVLEEEVVTATQRNDESR